jgi:hypothetical protein
MFNPIDVFVVEFRCIIGETVLDFVVAIERKGFVKMIDHREDEGCADGNKAESLRRNSIDVSEEFE